MPLCVLVAPKHKEAQFWLQNEKLKQKCDVCNDFQPVYNRQRGSNSLQTTSTQQMNESPSLSTHWHWNAIFSSKDESCKFFLPCSWRQTCFYYFCRDPVSQLYRTGMIAGLSTDGKSNPLQIKQKIRRAAESRWSRRLLTLPAWSIIKSIVLFGSCLILLHNHNIVHGVANTKSLTRVTYIVDSPRWTWSRWWICIRCDTTRRRGSRTTGSIISCRENVPLSVCSQRVAVLHL